MPPSRGKRVAQRWSAAYKLRFDVLWNIRADYAVWKHHRMAAKSPARSGLREGGPPSSPRLPSPPPLPELQLGPRSPSTNTPAGEVNLDDSLLQDDGAARRVRPGTSATDMARGPPFVPLHQLESPFQLQEYLKSSYSNVTRDDDSLTIKPITKESAMQLATPPIQQDTGEPVDRNLWLYELCRFLVQRTNRVIVSFFADAPPCSNQTCPEMRASEWQYLCAVHEPPKSCCAIDYCCHTLDWAANVLTSTKHFPSRLSLGGEGGSAYQSMRQLTNIFRRVYRIYAHAWFQHREAFWMLEQEEGLYKFFRTVCDAYTLIPEDNYTIPPEAEGDREELIETPVSGRGENSRDMHILRNDTPVDLSKQQQPPQYQERITEPTSGASAPTVAPTQRRHRHTPSTGTSVNSIAEGEEEDDNNTTQISQQVLPEPTATSTKAALSSPIKPRSPRPDMSIPISEPKIENFPAVEDPTPKPEAHGLDPFEDPSPAVADTEEAQEEEEEAPPTVTQSKPPPSPLSDSDQPQPEETIAITPPQTKVKTQELPPEEGQTVRSPGGGSIRTVSNDILSGLMAHHDDDDDDDEENPFEKLKGKQAFTTTGEKGAESSREAASSGTSSDPEEDVSQDRTEEADEEMGEIKLEKMTTAIKDDPAEHKTHGTDEGDKDKINDDGTKKDETAAGVV